MKNSKKKKGRVGSERFKTEKFLSGEKLRIK